MKKIIAIIVVFFIYATTAFAQLKTGDIAPEISLPNPNGEIVSLSSLKGKVVLIDFWASWCRPCRLSNPRVVKLYNKYKAKGFEVFAVSIDDDPGEWIKAIKNDKLPYSQVFDITGFDSEVIVKYMVEAIPTTFLLDKEGKIVAIDPEKKVLEKKIKQLLAK